MDEASAVAPAPLAELVPSAPSPTAVGRDFCARCGSPRDAATLRFCRRCGAPMAETQQVSSIEPTSVRAARRRPPFVVASLSLVTFNAYGIGWFGSSWADLGTDPYDDSMDGIGHALAMLVPIYGQIRAYAHFREIDRRLESVGSPARLDPRIMTAATFLSLAAMSLAFLGPTAAQVPALLTSLVLLAVVVALGQRALNAYWGRRDASMASSVRPVEILVLVVCGLSFVGWLGVAVSGLNKL